MLEKNCYFLAFDGFVSEVASAPLLRWRNLEWPDFGPEPEPEPEPELVLEVEPEELSDVSGGAAATGLVPFACLESFLR